MKLDRRTWPVARDAGPRGLEAPMHMKFTIGMALNPSLAAEVEIPVSWIAYRPAAIAGQKRIDRLSLAARDF